MNAKLALGVGALLCWVGCSAEEVGPGDLELRSGSLAPATIEPVGVDDNCGAAMVGTCCLGDDPQLDVNGSTLVDFSQPDQGTALAGITSMAVATHDGEIVGVVVVAGDRLGVAELTNGGTELVPGSVRTTSSFMLSSDFAGIEQVADAEDALTFQLVHESAGSGEVEISQLQTDTSLGGIPGFFPSMTIDVREPAPGGGAPTSVDIAGPNTGPTGMAVFDGALHITSGHYGPLYRCEGDECLRIPLDIDSLCPNPDVCDEQSFEMVGTTAIPQHDRLYIEYGSGVVALESPLGEGSVAAGEPYSFFPGYSNRFLEYNQHCGMYSVYLGSQIRQFAFFDPATSCIPEDTATYGSLAQPLGSPACSAPDSCENQCGGASLDQSCYCDGLCEGYGDCCADKIDECGSSAPSCEGSCGGPVAGGLCWCDDGCEGFGDCCVDKAAQCDGP